METHGSGHGVPTRNLRALRISSILILIYFVFEIAVALSTGSLSLLADAGHELSTFVAITISLVAVRLAATEPTPARTFGYLRVEVLAAFLNGLLLVGMAVLILVRGYARLLDPIEVPTLPMYAMAIGGIGLEIASLMIMYRGQKESLNIRGSFWHVMNAFLGSLAVIIAALFITFGGIYVADAWAGIIFALILLYAAYGILRDSVNILIDRTPPGIDLAQVDRDVSAVPGVLASHHLHARTVSGHITTFSGHIVVADMRDSERILREVREILEGRYRFALSTVQLESEDFAEGDASALEFKSPRGTR
ncbi:MAG: cation transporter [Coriobacteriales bacterium]|nr:cation transporter [Coriobacteriales bacterium]